MNEVHKTAKKAFAKWVLWTLFFFNTYKITTLSTNLNINFALGLGLSEKMFQFYLPKMWIILLCVKPKTVTVVRDCYVPSDIMKKHCSTRQCIQMVTQKGTNILQDHAASQSTRPQLEDWLYNHPASAVGLQFTSLLISTLNCTIYPVLLSQRSDLYALIAYTDWRTNIHYKEHCFIKWKLLTTYIYLLVVLCTQDHSFLLLYGVAQP
jgi:hypothetical protein